MSTEGSNEEKPTTQPLRKLALPPTTVDAVLIASRLRRIETWAERMARRSIPTSPVAFSVVLVRRFDVEYAPGSRAVDFARRLLPDTLAMNDVELTVSPYAPPMRQLSGVRQGVPMWRAGSPPRTSAREPSAQAPQPATPPSVPVPQRTQQGAKNKKEIPADLRAILNMHRALGRIE